MRKATADSAERQKANSVQVLAKAAVILDCLAERSELSAAELADRTGEPRSSVYRLLASLQQLDMIEPGTKRGSYRLGLKLLRLGSAVVARFDIRQAALPVMEHIHERTEETVFLCIRRGYEAVCIERIDGRWVQSMGLLLGGSLPLHIGASPRALLAFEPREFWEEYIREADHVAFTPKSPTSASDLRGLLEETLRTGCSVSDGDVVDGMAAVGAAVFDHRGAVCGAISMSGPRPKILGEKRAQSCELIVASAAQISAALGHGRVGQPPAAA